MNNINFYINTLFLLSVVFITSCATSERPDIVKNPTAGYILDRGIYLPTGALIKDPRVVGRIK
jgi:hypothetical protein